MSSASEAGGAGREEDEDEEEEEEDDDDDASLFDEDVFAVVNTLDGLAVLDVFIRSNSAGMKVFSKAAALCTCPSAMCT